ncbi:MAG: HDOD domain-containing protein [Desulfobacteraceae bacterium]|nr:HDOD domain-containing protein [Desulfobacteraceae bacterium]
MHKNAANHSQANGAKYETPAAMMRYLETIQELPTLSSVAIKVNSMLQDADVTARDLSDVIEKDQAMVAKLLKLVNSSFFGFSSKVSNIAHSIMILGFNTVYNAILSMAVIDALGAKNRINGLDMAGFWRHAISVAVVSKYLSQGLEGQLQEKAFTAGILHDIGKVVMARYFTERFSTLWEVITLQEISFVKAERQHFPMGHDAMGAFLSRCWNLPEELSTAVAQHHHPEILPRPCVLALVVNAADALVNIHLENRKMPDQWAISNAAKSLLGEKIRTVDQWFPTIVDEINAAQHSILD